jgi:hypothetical protein
MTIINAQYNVARAQSLPVRIAAHQRRRMFDDFTARLKPREQDTVLDVGVTSDDSYDHSNYFVSWYPHKHRITAAGLDDAAFLEHRYPGLTFCHADGRALPFADNSFDYVHSSAVLEHAGSREQQTRFVAELWRVARKGIYLTTPNRWFPVEFHTVLPLVHWLPRPWFTAILRSMGLGFFAEEANLNLLSGKTLRHTARDAGITHPRIHTVALLGWPTNLLLCAQKK